MSSGLNKGKTSEVKLRKTFVKGIFLVRLPYSMVLILGGNSEIGANM